LQYEEGNGPLLEVSIKNGNVIVGALLDHLKAVC